MFRCFRKKDEVLAIQGEIPRFLATGRQPIATEVKRGRLQIISIVGDFQHGATAAGDHARLNMLFVRLDRLISADTKVQPILVRRRHTWIGMEDVESQTGLRIQARGFAPCYEAFDRVADPKPACRA